MRRESNKKAWQALTSIKNNYTIQAGWFEKSKYDDGTPIGGIAAVQNYGSVINHPGGTPYFIGPDGMAQFLSKDSFYGQLQASRGMVTKPHTIVIPPTHFMEACVNKNTENWKAQIQQAWTSVFLGNIEPDKAMEMIGRLIEGDIAKSIKNIEGPPLAKSTIRARLNTYANKKAPKDKSGISKRLAGTGQMLNAVSHNVEKK